MVIVEEDNDRSSTMEEQGVNQSSLVPNLKKGKLAIHLHCFFLEYSAFSVVYVKVMFTHSDTHKVHVVYYINYNLKAYLCKDI